MRFNTGKAVVAMFSISVLVILVLNFGVGDPQQEIQYSVDTITQYDKGEAQYLRDSLEIQRQKQAESLYEDRLGKSRKTAQMESRNSAYIKSMPEPEVMAMETQEPQHVIVVQLPPSEQGVDWKSLISWAIAALNGVVLLVMNIKNIGKNR
jgi:hypothetical protein